MPATPVTTPAQTAARFGAAVIALVVLFAVVDFVLWYNSESAAPITQYPAPTRLIPSSNISNICGYQVDGTLAAKWQVDQTTTALGCPVGPEEDALPSPQGTTGKILKLVGGDGNYLILQTNGANAGLVFHVRGCIFMLYNQIGNTASVLGFPLNEEHDAPGGLQEDFEGGHIYWERATSQCRVVR